ncbi:MAG: DUF4445 domain-containing protein [Desulfobacter sp.]|nr:MAG: DUF4445 domain-containing protein [Desulfobacter sp.]
MTEESYTIELAPHGRKIKADKGEFLINALKGKNIILRSDCGGKGKCGKCRVDIIHPLTGDREDVLSCNHPVESNLKIEIPPEALFSTHTLGKAAIDLPGEFTDRFSASQPGKTTASDRFGIAADLGTTTIAVYLCNMTRGTVMASASIKNPQALYGDDVMSRIGAIGQAPANLPHLQGLVVGAMEEGLRELTKAKRFKGIDISKMVVVGNPAMIHIFTGVDPAPIGVSPYQPAFYEPKTLASETLGFSSGNFPVHTLPQVSGFIGGDILAAALAVDLPNQPVGTLLIDLGTNGELMLRGEQGLFATSCATGPAFEGATLACGMQAVPGAVNRVSIPSPGAQPEFDCIIGPKNNVNGPTGICGSGVVSAVAQFCRQQIILPDGGFNPHSGSPSLNRDKAGKYRYTIAPGRSELRLGPVYISQKDIRSVQLGKGALITGIDFLLKKAGIPSPEKLIIAGAFGSHLNQGDMKTLGMIPNLEDGRIKMAGNAAGTGAVMALCHGDYLEAARAMTGKIKVVDLAADPDFHADFVKRLGFPEALPA